MSSSRVTRSSSSLGSLHPHSALPLLPPKADVAKSLKLKKTQALQQIKQELQELDDNDDSDADNLPQVPKPAHALVSSRSLLCKISCFTGDGSMDAALWLKEYERAMVVNCIETAKQAPYFAACMRGAAAAWLWEDYKFELKGKDDLDSYLICMKTSLLDRFRSSGPLSKLQRKSSVRSARQGSLSVAEFSALLQERASAADMTKDETLECFLDGLRPSLKRHLMSIELAEPTLPKFIEAARRRESAEDSSRSSSSSSTSALRSAVARLAALQVESEEEEEPAPPPASLAAIIAAAVEAALDKRLPAGASSARREPPGPCPRCGKTGHWARECVTPRGNNNNNNYNNYKSSSNSNSKPKTCFRCGKPGHFARECTSAAPTKRMSEN
jgi:hypothetical protein